MPFNIQNHSGISGLKVFVSAYTNGKDDWFDLASDFSDPAKSHWNRDGWEVIVFKNPADDTRRGWYISCGGGRTVDVTFVGFSQDLGITRL